MMIEKRFTVDKSGDFRDNKTGVTIVDFGYNFNGMECRDILELMNNLSDGNEQLKKENEELKHEINYLENRLDDCVCFEKENRDLKEENLELSQKILKGMFEMIEKTDDIEICAEISTKRMYLILLKAQEMILENNPQHKKKEIVSLLSSIEHDILMLNDKNNSINRDLFD